MHRFPYQSLSFVACVVFIVGLLAGRAAMSIGMIVLFCCSLLNPKVLATWKAFKKDRSALLLTGLFFLFCVSFFWSDNTSYFFTRVQLMLPFLVLPFAFKGVQWSRTYYDYLAIIYITVCLAGVGWSLWQYIDNMESINAAYGISKSMPTPFAGDHIRFGVGVVIAISFCFQLIKESKWIKWFWIGSAVFFIVYLHLLASKTALLAFYIITLYEILRLVIRRKKIVWGISLFLFVVSLPIIFYNISPSFRNKISYSVYSYYELLNKEAQTNVSDEGRIVSYKIAWGVILNNPILGVGVGDGLDEMQQAYNRESIKTEKILYPHNQFIYMTLVLGLVGLFYFLYCGLYLFRKHFFGSAWLSSFLLIFIIPFMVEAFFNTQYGIALFLFFFLLLKSRDGSMSKM